MYTVLVILLIILLLGGLPIWPYSRGWPTAYPAYPYAGGGILLLILIILLVGIF